MTLPVITDLDARRENVRLRKQLAEKDKVIDAMLEAPYRGMGVWAISLACANRDHPRKATAYLSANECYCGHVKYPEPTA